MNILCIGDLHITINNFEFIQSLQEKISVLFSLEKYDLIVLLGDVLDKFGILEIDCATKFIKQLSELAPTYVLVGNHDYMNPHEFLSQNHWLNPIKGFKNITVIDRPTRAKNLIFCPYVPEGRFIEALKIADENWLEAKVIFAHQGFNGAITKSGPLICSDEWSSELPIVVSGHIHMYQYINGVYYSGSVSEKKQNFLLSVKMDKDEISVQKQSLDKFLKRSFYGTVEELLNEDLTDAEITIQDSAENIRNFKETEQYRHLNANNKIYFNAHMISFIDLYRSKILDTGDVYTYCAAEKILQDIEQDENNHIFISIK